MPLICIRSQREMSQDSYVLFSLITHHRILFHILGNINKSSLLTSIIIPTDSALWKGSRSGCWIVTKEGCLWLGSNQLYQLVLNEAEGLSMDAVYIASCFQQGQTNILLHEQISEVVYNIFGTFFFSTGELCNARF